MLNWYPFFNLQTLNYTYFKVLHEKPELLDLPDPLPTPTEITDQMVSFVASMGFDVDSARAALHHFQADVQRSIDELLKTGGLALDEWNQSIPSTTATSSETSMETGKSC